MPEENINLKAALDKLLAHDWPVLTVPHNSSDFLPLRTPGQRLLLASDGLYLEARTAFLHAIVPKAPAQLPFAPIYPKITLRVGIKQHIQNAFAQLAFHSLPAECGAWITADPNQPGDQHLLPLVADHASPAHLTYRTPSASEMKGELLADIHSHPLGPNGFSEQDDADDFATRATRLSLVVDLSSGVDKWVGRVLVHGQPYPFGGSVPIVRSCELP